MKPSKRIDTRVRADLGKDYPKVAQITQDHNALVGADVWTVPTMTSHLIATHPLVKGPKK